MSTRPRRKSEEEAPVHPRNTLNALSGREWIRFTKSWVKCDGKRRDFTDDILMHPASFPPELAMEFINFFTRPGDTVLDPFAGCGSTLDACVRTGRKGIGVELSPKWVEACRRRMQALQAPDVRVLNADAQRLSELDLPTIDFCFTSPPYWSMLRWSRGGVKSTHKKRAETGLDTVYGDDVQDLGNVADYEQYRSGLVAVFGKLYPRLRNGGFLVIVLQNIRLPSGEMVPVAWDLARDLAHLYVLRQERIWVQDQKMLGIWGYPTTYVSNVHHHYCLILQKVDTVC
ncbi:MAG: TRM11 family SAM-dependent methyltransferase [Candidatus Xenobia bacterium]